ncbi:MAG TPA: hypothetical protein VFU63_01030 [Ktedonobacterales bacterium]|nr:hypothetical protein [Ktedonobacterales bacterium]
MSTDGQNFDDSTTRSDDTQPQTTVNALEEVVGAQSRRKFLRTAVISGVAVATIGATAGVAAAATQPHTGVLKRFNLTNPLAASGPVTCSMCFEDTNLNGSIDSFNVSKTGNSFTTQPGSFYIWFTAHNVPNGDYTITISPEPGSSGTPFVYATKGNNAFLYQRDAGKAVDCPVYYDAKAKTGTLPGDEKRSADSVPDLFADPNPPATAGPYTVSGGPVDLQVTAHIAWGKDQNLDGGDTTYSFTGKIFSSTDQDTPLCTATVNVKAIKNY